MTRYSPASVVMAILLMPASALVTVTVTPGRTAPVASVTVPETSANRCAEAAEKISGRVSRKTTTVLDFHDFSLISEEKRMEVERLGRHSVAVGDKSPLRASGGQPSPAWDCPYQTCSWFNFGQKKKTDIEPPGIRARKADSFLPWAIQHRQEFPYTGPMRRVPFSLVAGAPGWLILLSLALAQPVWKQRALELLDRGRVQEARTLLLENVGAGVRGRRRPGPAGTNRLHLERLPGSSPNASPKLPRCCGQTPCGWSTMARRCWKPNRPGQPNVSSKT